MYTHETKKYLEVTQAKSSNFILQIPTALKHRLAMDAAQRGMTIRSVTLEALFEVGYDIPLEERKDKHKTRTYMKPSKQAALESAGISDHSTA